MSKRSKKSTSTSFGVSEEFVPTIPESIGTDPSSLPFPVWSDHEVNMEEWDIPKKKVDSKKDKAPSSDPEHYLYEDDQLIHMPLNVYKWKRPNKALPDTNFLVYNERGQYSNLMTESRHLLQYGCMRKFMDLIKFLEYLAYTKPWEMEGVTPDFIPTTDNNPWRPWHHIYSKCKCGKGQVHNPQVNKIGKYIVRLFWMGYWRKIVVDDLLPVDRHGNILIPTLDVEKEYTLPFEKEVELWPFLIFKAMLKVGSLSWNDRSEEMSFSYVHCFTGWGYEESILTKNMGLNIWENITMLVDNYVWPEDAVDATKPDLVEIESSENKKGKKKKKNERMGGKKKSKMLTSENSSKPFIIIGQLEDMRAYPSDYIPGVTPCWDSYFLILMTRDIPWNKPAELPNIAPWKRFRWLDWAVKKGIWPDPNPETIICIKTVFGTAQLSYPMSLETYSLSDKKSTKDISQIASKDKEEIAKDIEKKKNKKTNNKKTKSKASKKSSGSSKKSKSSDTKKKEKKKKGYKPMKFPPPPDPSLWLDFRMVQKHIESFYMFFIPIKFPFRIRITDLEPPQYKQTEKLKTKPNKEEKSKNSEQYVKHSHQLKAARNEPLYLFCDTLDVKLIALNILQSGCSKYLKKISVEEVKEEGNIETEFLCNIRTCSAYAMEISDSEVPLEKAPEYSPMTQYTIVDYNWMLNSLGKKNLHDSTCGRSGKTHNIDPGRYIYAIYLRSEESYILDLWCDSPLVVGSLELINEHMAQESELFTEFCYNVSSAFGKLIQKFGTPEYVEGIRHLFTCLKPEIPVTKQETKIIEEAFLDELFYEIEANYSFDKLPLLMLSLRTLFLNPNRMLSEAAKQRSLYVTKELDRCMCEVDSQEEIMMIKEKERAAVTIQSVFKKLLVRKLLNLHKPDANDHLLVFETLKGIYNSIFNVQNRLSKGLLLLRKLILKNPKMRDLRERYAFYRDLSNVINLQNFTGFIPTYVNRWVLIARYVFHCDSDDLVLMKVCLFCDLYRYVVRVFDNDNGKEVPRLTHTVSVTTYKKNRKGYTVICYGWSQKEKNLPWKLSFITQKIDGVKSIIVTDKKVILKYVAEVYCPNILNRICRCLVKVKQNSVLTFRLSVSSKDVNVLLRCSYNNKILSEVMGEGNLIIPVVNLEHFDFDGEPSPVKHPKKSKSTILSRKKSISFANMNTIGSKKSKSDFSLKSETTYVIEAYVLENSWLLTEKEWEAVESYKNNKLYINAKNNKFAVPEDGTVVGPERSTYFGNFELPFWVLQAVYDESDSVVIMKDLTREQEILKLKESWYEGNPEKYEKSKEIRENYLLNNYKYVPLNDVDKIHVRTSTAALISADDLNIIPTSKIQDEIHCMDKISESLFMHTVDNKTTFVEEKIAPKYLVKPEDPYKKLPPLNLEQYYKPAVEPFAEENVVVLSPELRKQIRFERHQNKNDYEDMVSSFHNDLIKVSDEYVGYITLLYKWYQEYREESNKVLQKGYIYREKYIQELMNEEKTKKSSTSKSPTEKKEKKKKKKK